MTVHQAKGLEFPIVVLAGMANAIYDPAPDIGVIRRDRYEFRLTGGRASLGYTDWDECDRLPRSRAERVRLLYVACTRARDHLVVSLCGANRGSGDPYASLLWGAMPANPSDVTALEDPPVVVETRGSDPVEPLPSGWANEVTRIRAASAVPCVASPSGRGAEVLGLESASEPEESGPDESGPDETGPADAETASEVIDATVGEEVRAARDGRPLGRAVHAALDRLVRLGGLPQPEDVESACRDAAADEDVADDAVLMRVRAALTSELMVEALTAPRRWAELYLAAPVDDGAVRVVEGFADLVFERGDGYVVVDYKTDETISAEARQHYADQLATYAELVKLATGSGVAETVILHVGETQAEEIRL
jgi:ATP-dependent helicase/nuclease subunit A